MSRDKLLAYLWPEAGADRARHLLSDSVYRINRALGGEIILPAGDALRLSPALPSDVGRFEDAIAAGDDEAAAELYAGPFLDGFFVPGSAELERWIEGERRRLAQEYAGVLERLAEAAERAGDLRAAVRWWRRSAAHDPTSSRVALRLMEALERSGDRPAAIRHAGVHGRLLQQELGAPPDPDVTALARRLLTAPLQPPAPSIAELPSVAVLPFLDLGHHPDNALFADGVTEDVIAHLTKVRSLKVISRGSVMPFKGSGRSPREIGAALRVRTVLEGSVRRAGDRVRVVAQLVDSATGELVWGETYDRRLTDIFAIQTDVALRIAAALQATLSADERSRIGREPTRDLQAYRLYLHGRHSWARYTGEGICRGIECFERAVALDPTYALAYTALASAYGELATGQGGGTTRPEVAYGRARDAVTRALALDRSLGEAHAVSALLRLVHDFDWAGAEAEFKLALELSPGAADTYAHYGWLCAALERYDEALALVIRAQELDPLVHRADLPTVLLRAGRHPEALQAAARCVEVEPGYARGRSTLGWALLMNGRHDEGVAELETAVRLAPDDTLYLAQLGEALGLCGKVERGREVLHDLQAMSRERYVSPYHLAYVYTGLGDHDLAMDCLEQAYAERAGGVYGIRGSFLFAPLRTHPRFQALLERMDVPAPMVTGG